MPSIIRDFRRTWPNIILNLHFDERYADLVGGRFDVAIRVAQQLNDSNLLSRRLGSTRQVLVASPGYLDLYGTPTNVLDLPKYRCIGLGSGRRQIAAWHFSGKDGPIDVQVERILTANNNLALILAACLGEGILSIPELFVSAELAQGRLREILPQFSDPNRSGIFAVYPTRKPATKVRVFVDFVANLLNSPHALDRWAPFSAALELTPAHASLD
jgi:DNA-binding transcriptional LysR family regulator